MRDLHLAPWTLIDDDGQDLLLVDAFNQPAEPILAPDRAAFLDLLERLSGDGADGVELDDRAQSTLDELLRLGVLREGLAPEQHDPRTSELFLGHLLVQLEACDDPRVHVPALKRILRAHVDGPGRIMGFVLRVVGLRDDPAWARWAEVSALLSEFFTKPEDAAGFDPRSPMDDTPRGLSHAMEIPALATSHGEEARAFCDAFGGSRCLVEDRSELLPPEHREAWLEEQLAATRELAEEGFACHVVLDTAFPADLVERAERWMTEGLCAGVRVEPRFGTGDARWDEARFEAGIAAMDELGRRLRGKLPASHPWRPILTAAVVPVAETRTWNKRQSVVFLGADGATARSHLHARLGLHEPVESLFPGAFDQGPGGWLADRASAGLEGDALPDCASCGFASLCDKFWTPAVDAYAQSGDARSANLTARLECELRKQTLSALIDELRQSTLEKAEAVARDQRAVFEMREDKTVAVHRVGR